jgi:AAA domain-containing protein
VNRFPGELEWTEAALDAPFVVDDADQSVLGPRLVALADIEMRDIEWLDEGFVPEGTLTILQGHGGVGKGAWTCQLAASVTRADAPGRVLFAVAEDDYASVLKPRLVAAGADLCYVQAIENVTLPEDIGWLDEQVAAAGDVPVRLLVVDPVLTHLSGKVESYKDHEVKRALRPLVALSERRRVTTVGVLHFTKDTGRGARFSGQASGAFGNTARSVLSMAVHDEDDYIRLLEVSKSNFAALGLGRRYQLELVAVDGLDTPQPVLRHAGDADKTVDAALKATTAKQKTVDKHALRELILRELATGGKSLDYLKAVGKDELGAAAKAVYTAATALKDEQLVTCRKLSFDEGWRWELPNFPPEQPAAGENGLNNELPPELSNYNVKEISNFPPSDIRKVRGKVRHEDDNLQQLTDNALTELGLLPLAELYERYGVSRARRGNDGDGVERPTSWAS